MTDPSEIVIQYDSFNCIIFLSSHQHIVTSPAHAQLDYGIIYQVCYITITAFTVPPQSVFL